MNACKGRNSTAAVRAPLAMGRSGLSRGPQFTPGPVVTGDGGGGGFRSPWAGGSIAGADAAGGGELLAAADPRNGDGIELEGGGALGPSGARDGIDEAASLALAFKRASALVEALRTSSLWS